MFKLKTGHEQRAISWINYNVIYYIWHLKTNEINFILGSAVCTKYRSKHWVILILIDTRYAQIHDLFRVWRCSAQRPPSHMLQQRFYRQFHNTRAIIILWSIMWHSYMLFGLSSILQMKWNGISLIWNCFWQKIKYICFAY